MEFEEEEFWKCRKHPVSQQLSGVCPSCLRDRLLRLCPDCANVRPCACFPSSSSSSSSSFSSAFDPARSSVSGGIGAVGRVSSLIESEPAFRRSRSLAFAAVPQLGSRRWGNLWGLLKGKEEEEDRRSEVGMRIDEEETFLRSRSLGVAGAGAAAARFSDSRSKGRKWHFPSPMRAFRVKKTAKVVHERSPLPMCRG